MIETIFEYDGSGNLIGTQEVTVSQPATVRTSREVLTMLYGREFSAIYSASKADSDVFFWLQMLSGASEVRSDDPQTVQGCQIGVAKGLLTPARVLEVFGVTL